MAFSRQEYWSGLPFPIPGDLQNPRIKPISPALTGRFFTTAPTSYPLKSSIPITNSLLSLCIYRLIFKLFIFIIYFQINDIPFIFKLFMALILRCCSGFLASWGQGSSQLWCVGLSLWWCLLSLYSTSSGAGAHGLNCSTARGIFPNQGSSLCPALEGRFFTTEPPEEADHFLNVYIFTPFQALTNVLAKKQQLPKYSHHFHCLQGSIKLLVKLPSR